MHEVSLCQSMLSQLEGIARKHQAEGIARVTLQIGPLSGVEPELLKQAFEVLRADSVASSAKLEIETTAVRVRCPECGRTSEVATNHLSCPHCDA